MCCWPPLSSSFSERRRTIVLGCLVALCAALLLARGAAISGRWMLNRGVRSLVRLLATTQRAGDPVIVEQTASHLRAAQARLPAARFRLLLHQAALANLSGNMDEAVRLLEEAHQLAPASLFPPLRLIAIHEQTWQWDEAIRWYVWVLAHSDFDEYGRNVVFLTYPPRQWRQIQRTLEALAAGDLPAARAILDSIDGSRMEGFIVAYLIAGRQAQLGAPDAVLARVGQYQPGENKFQDRWAIGLLPQALELLQVHQRLADAQLATTLDWLEWRGEVAARDRTCERLRAAGMAGICEAEASPSARSSGRCQRLEDTPEGQRLLHAAGGVKPLGMADLGPNLIHNGAFAGPSRAQPQGWTWIPAANRPPYANALFEGGISIGAADRNTATGVSIYGLWTSRPGSAREPARAGFWQRVALTGSERYLLTFCYRTFWTQGDVGEVWLGNDQNVTLFTGRPESTNGQWRRYTYLVELPRQSAVSILLRSWGVGRLDFDDVGLFAWPAETGGG